jgi:hypothetical protein
MRCNSISHTSRTNSAESFIDFTIDQEAKKSMKYKNHDTSSMEFVTISACTVNETSQAVLLMNQDHIPGEDVIYWVVFGYKI